MKRVAIMCRVSSDEQAKGYSLDAQHEALIRYCERHNYEIVYNFREDHSAKSFERPQWKKWMKYAKDNHRDIDLLLFTSWDRFSRNISSSYGVIAQLEKLKITPVAIDQPTKDKTPSSIIVQAMSLALAEADNMMRSQKIRGGIRQALKQGRWIKAAIIGYTNQRDENNKPIMIPNPEVAPLIRYAFEAFAEGKQQVEIRKELKEKGLNMSKSNFSRLLRREAYAGKIVVPATEDEPMMIVESVHPALISEQLFYKVQSILEGNTKKRNRLPKTVSKRDELPLRGHLSCSHCNKNLTGSRSRGRSGKRYFYYHCNHCHKERFAAGVVNEKFEELLSAFHVDTNITKLYHLIMEKMLSSNGMDNKLEIKKLNSKLEKEKLRLENLQDLLVDNTISSEDYKSMRTRYKRVIYEIEDKIRQHELVKDGFEQFLISGLDLLENLCETYRNSSVQLKQKIIGSIFPEKIFFDGKQCRTTKINQAVLLILSVDKGFKANKKGQHPINKMLSSLVEKMGVEPTTS